jgi:hypothetical protein
VVAAIGIVFTALFLISIPVGINTTIALISVLIIIPYYFAIFLGIQKKFYKILLLIFTLVVIFTFNGNEILTESWSDYEEIQLSQAKKIIVNVFYKCGALAAIMTFTGIINK